MNEPRSAAEIIVEGYVQGVGYRTYAQRRAEGLGLSGFVMNLKDGRVRARAEGSRALIQDFVREPAHGHLLHPRKRRPLLQLAHEVLDERT